jgi:hypothetical protein
LDGSTEKYFTPAEIDLAMRISDVAARRAKESANSNSTNPGSKADSLSRQ